MIKSIINHRFEEDKLLSKLSYLSAENEKLQELLMIERKSKEKYKQISNERPNSANSYFDVEVHELNDQVLVLQRNIELLQSYINSSNAQNENTRIEEYESQISQLKADLKEACSYNVVLMAEVDKISSDISMNSCPQLPHIEMDSLRNQNRNLQKCFNPQYHNIELQQMKQQNTGQQSTPENEIMRFIGKLREKDEVIIRLLGVESRLSETIIQLQNQYNPKVKHSSMLNNAKKIIRPDQKEVKEKFKQIIGTSNNQDQSIDSSRSQKSGSFSIKSSPYVELLKEQITEKDRFIEFINKNQYELTLKLTNLEQELKDNKQQLNEKVQELMHSKILISQLEEQVIQIEELNSWRTRTLELEKSLELQKLISEEELIKYKNQLITEERKFILELESKSNRINELQDTLNQKQQVIADLKKGVVRLVDPSIQELREEIVLLKQNNLIVRGNDKLCELAQISILPQLLPNKIKQLINHTEVEYKFLEELQEEKLTHIQVSILFSYFILQLKILIRTNSFILQLQNEAIHSSKIISSNFDPISNKFGLLMLNIYDNYERQIKFTGPDVSQFYALILQLFKKFDIN